MNNNEPDLNTVLAQSYGHDAAEYGAHSIGLISLNQWLHERYTRTGNEFDRAAAEGAARGAYDFACKAAHHADLALQNCK